jgi:hypothetical protein
LPIEEIVFDPQAGKPFWLQVYKGAVGGIIFARLAFEMHELLESVSINTKEQLPSWDKSFRTGDSRRLENLHCFGHKVA